MMVIELGPGFKINLKMNDFVLECCFDIHFQNQLAAHKKQVS